MKRHEFDPGFTGLSTRCNRLVLDERGYGVDCGRPMEDPVHFQRKAECVGCLTGYDIGLPSSEVAYPHPECPEHGDTADVPLSPEQEEAMAAGAHCWCGAPLIPRSPGDEIGLGCSADIWHTQERPQAADKVDAMAMALSLHRTEATVGIVCSTCDGAGCFDCTDPA